MSIQILEKLNNMLNTGLCFHDESNDLFNYLSLEGFAAWHEWQYITERLYQKKIKKLITSTYNIISKNSPQNDFNILSLIKNKNRKQLKPDDRYNIIKMSFIEYEKFERNNLMEYENMAKELSNNSDISLYAYVLEKIKDVENELAFLNDFILSHETMDWDFPQIISEQDTLKERYNYLLRKFYKSFPKAHHFNSLVSADNEA